MSHLHRINLSKLSYSPRTHFLHDGQVLAVGSRFDSNNQLCHPVVNKQIVDGIELWIKRDTEVQIKSDSDL